MIFLWLFLSAMCFVYGLVIKAVGSGSRFYVVWMFGAFIMFLFAVAAKFHIWSRLPMGIRVVFLSCVTLGFLVVLFFEGLVLSKFWEKGQKDLDVIIVLGAQVRENTPSVVLKYRLDEAYTYLQEYTDTICVVSGGKGDNERYPEAQIMKQYLVEQGIAEDRVLEENQSVDTMQNIIFSKKLFPETAKVGIVTNNFHMFRALQIARDEGLTSVCGISAGSKLLYLPNNMFREFFGEVKYLLFYKFRRQ